MKKIIDGIIQILLTVLLGALVSFVIGIILTNVSLVKLGMLLGMTWFLGDIIILVIIVAEGIYECHKK